MVFRNLCVLVLWTKVASALERLLVVQGYISLHILSVSDKHCRQMNILHNQPTSGAAKYCQINVVMPFYCIVNLALIEQTTQRNIESISHVHFMARTSRQPVVGCLLHTLLLGIDQTLTHSGLEISLTSGVRTFYTFGNNFGIMH